MATGSGGQASLARPTIVLAVEQPEPLGRYGDALRLLAGRGCRIHVVYDDPLTAGAVEALARDCPGMTAAPTPARSAERWPAFVAATRLLAERRPTARVLLERLAQAAPVDEDVRSALEETRPAVVVVVAPFDPGSRSRDFLDAARSLGVPTVVCVDGWADPGRGGAVRARPDRLLVWSTAQREQAVREGADPASVVVTGAQRLEGSRSRDHEWSREQLCAAVGLDPKRPFLLFAGSARTEAAAEPFFVERWLRRIRGAGDARVARVGVLVRPHPSNERRYLSFDVSQLDDVAIWPAADDAAATRLLPADAVRFSAGVVALDPGALPDAVAAGRPFLAFAGHEHGPAQAAALESLTPDAAALLHVAADFDEHLRQLARLLRGELDAEPRTVPAERLGLSPDAEREAAAVLADAIEAASGLRVEPRVPGRAQRALQAAVSPVAGLVARRRRRAAAPAKEAPAWLPLALPPLRAWIRLLVLRAYAADLWRRRRSVPGRVGRLLRR